MVTSSADETAARSAMETAIFIRAIVSALDTSHAITRVCLIVARFTGSAVRVGDDGVVTVRI